MDLIDLHADGFDPVMSAAELQLWRQGQPVNDQVADYQRRLRARTKSSSCFRFGGKSCQL
ncbi:hypothetical protein L3X07_04570 [Levilactobacillus brevis]|nr:hypothetical protein [Levilactobacillus brevis]